MVNGIRDLPTLVGDVPFSTAIALWSLERPLARPLVGRYSPARGLFFVLSPPGNGYPRTSGGRRRKVFAFMRLLRNFQWYDFASIFVYGKV